MNSRLKALIPEATQIAMNLLHTPRRPLRLGLDLDGTITECPEFFQMLSNIWTGFVYILTYRTDYEKAKQTVEDYGIKYQEIILVNSLTGKAAVIAEKEIGVYFDDQPEMVKNVPENVQVLLVRNGGNFDFEDQRWMMSEKTGKIL